MGQANARKQGEEKARLSKTKQVGGALHSLGVDSLFGDDLLMCPNTVLSHLPQFC
jgi:hypothetical protein